MTEQQKLRELLENSSHIVFFGGAGVSTESGVPDFRSEDGLYGSKQAKTYPYPPETMLSHSFFKRHTEQFFEYYFDRMVYPQAKPNAAHYALAKLEAQGKLSAVVTQNIDGLHQQAGSKRVYELHGSVLRNHCIRCGASYSLEQMLEYKGKGVPRCSCGGVIKPDVVLYEESLDSDVLEGRSAPHHGSRPADRGRHLAGSLSGGGSAAILRRQGACAHQQNRNAV